MCYAIYDNNTFGLSHFLVGGHKIVLRVLCESVSADVDDNNKLQNAYYSDKKLLRSC